MKQFKLVNIDNDTNDSNIQEHDDGDDVEKYNDMKDSNSKQEPVVSSVDRKRSNKTEQCSKCLKFCNRKTMLYAHKCKAQTQPTQQPATPPPAQQTPPTQQPTQQAAPPVQPEQPPPAPAQQHVPITEQDIHEYLQKQQKQRMEKLKEIRQARFNNLISRAF